MCARRTGGKHSHSLENLVGTVRKELDEIGQEMDEESTNHFNSHIKNLPSFSRDGDKLVFDEQIQSGLVYEMAFEGNDAEAEMVEKSTDLTFLGNSTSTYSEAKSCIITGKPTHNRVYLARTY